MRREVMVLLSLALPACGARTGLAEVVSDAGRELEADALVEAEADVETDAGPLLCPLMPPSPDTTCQTSASAIECAYLPSPPADGGIEAWSCMLGGWAPETSVADTTFTTCEQLVCFPDVYIECIVGDASRCCTCSDDMTVDQCGPC